MPSRQAEPTGRISWSSGPLSGWFVFFAPATPRQGISPSQEVSHPLSDPGCPGSIIWRLRSRLIDRTPWPENPAPAQAARSSRAASPSPPRRPDRVLHRFLAGEHRRQPIHRLLLLSLAHHPLTHAVLRRRLRHGQLAGSALAHTRLELPSSPTSACPSSGPSSRQPNQTNRLSEIRAHLTPCPGMPNCCRAAVRQTLGGSAGTGTFLCGIAARIEVSRGVGGHGTVIYAGVDPGFWGERYWPALLVILAWLKAAPLRVVTPLPDSLAASCSAPPWRGVLRPRLAGGLRGWRSSAVWHSRPGRCGQVLRWVWWAESGQSRMKSLNNAG